MVVCTLSVRTWFPVPPHAPLSALATLNRLQTKQVQSSYSSARFGVAAFTTLGASYDYQLLEQLMLDVLPVEVALDGLTTTSL